MRQPLYSSGPQQPVRPEYNGQSGVLLDPYYSQGAGQVPGYEQQFKIPVMQQPIQNVNLESMMMKDALAAL